MTAITAQQLQYAYSWVAKAPDNPRVTGHPDSDLLNRGEGYEMLHFLNKYCTSLAQAQKAERIIKTALPSTVRGHENVREWLNSNWSLYH